MASQTEQSVFEIHTESTPRGELAVRRLRARESISSLYSAEVLLEPTGDADLAVEAFHAILGEEVTIEHAGGRAFAGVAREIDVVDDPRRGRLLYRLRIAPRLWRATLSHRSRVFQDMTVPEIARRVLLDTGLLEGTHFELRISALYPKREYTVQYQESDFAFFCRLVEHEGISFFFEDREGRERVIVADSNGAFRETEGLARISHRDFLASLSERTRFLEKTVTLRDYNYRTPRVELKASARADQGGAGESIVYGDHFKTPEEGARIAKLRAEEILARKRVVRGVASCAGLRPGHRIEIAGHRSGELAGTYLLVSVRHDVRVTFRGESAPSEPYVARFEAIRIETPYRPRRKTPAPQIVGLVHAKIDGEQATSIDEHGRYKVLLPFDSAAAGSGRASRWIRMAQPQAGRAGKHHFPLEVGTEVLLAHIDGDPDRPIIAAAVPNTETPSPVVAKNAMQNVITTRSGIRMVLDDRSHRD